MDNSDNSSPIILLLIIISFGVVGYLFLTNQIPGIRLPVFSVGNPIQGIIDSLAGVGEALTGIFSGFFR